MHIRTVFLCIVCTCIFVHAEWEAIGPYGGYLYSVAASPADSSVVWVMSYTSPAKIARSTNGGDSWEIIGALTMGYGLDMVVDAVDANRLYAAGGNYAHRSTDGGFTWSYSYVPNSYFYSMAVHATTSGTVFGAGMKYDNSLWNMAVHRSTNGGQNWNTSVLYAGTGHSYARDIAVSHSNPDIIYVCGYGYETAVVPLVFKSTDGGATFVDMSANTPAGMYFYTIGVHPTDPNIVYLGASNGLYRSTDGGSTWVYEYNSTSNYNICTTPASADLVFCGAYSSVCKSTDAGATWIDSGTGLEGYYWRGVAVNSFNPSKVYAGSRLGFFKTTDCGVNWVESNNNMKLASIYGFAVAPTLSPLLYTSCEEFGIYKSTNHGDDWNRLPTPLTCGNICAFAVNPENPSVVLGLEGAG